MARLAQSLQVGTVPEERLIAAVFLNVINIHGQHLDTALEAGATERFILQHTEAQVLPPSRGIPPVRTGVDLMLQAAGSRRMHLALTALH